VRLPMDCGCNSKRMPISAKSCRAFTPSLVFPFTFNKVPMMLSHTFFQHASRIYNVVPQVYTNMED